MHPHYATYSPNGWTTEETFKDFLTGIRDFYGFEDLHTIHLILDIFRAHFTPSVCEHAENLNIELIPIPAGMTDEKQSLDRKIFAPLKRFAARLFRLRFQDNLDHHRTKKDACADLICAWGKLTPEKIMKAFELPEENYWMKVGENELWLQHCEASKASRTQKRK